MKLSTIRRGLVANACSLMMALSFSGSVIAKESLSIEAAVLRALDHDPQSILAKAVLREERLASNLDRGVLLPTIGVTGNYFWTTRDLESVFFTEGSEDFASSQIGLEIRQPLYRWDFKARLSRAETQNFRAQARRKRFGNQLMSRVLTRYLDVLRARERQRFANAELRAISEQLEVAQNRFEVGLIAVTGVREAQARLDLAETRRIEADQELAAASDDLLASTGMDAAAIPEVDVEFTATGPSPAALDHWQELAAEHNADTAIALADFRLAEANVAVARKEIVPSLDLAAGYAISDSDSRIGSRSDEGRVGLELNIPIYDGGISPTKVKIAKAKLEQTAASLDHQKTTANNDTRRAWRALNSSILRIAALERASESARLAWQATRDGNELGDRTIAEVLDAQTLMIQAETDTRLSRYDYLQAWLNLRALAGVLVLEDLKSLDAFLTEK